MTYDNEWRKIHYRFDPCDYNNNKNLKYPEKIKFSELESEIDCCFCLAKLKKVKKGILIKCNHCKRGIPKQSKFCLYCGKTINL